MVDASHEKPEKSAAAPEAAPSSATPAAGQASSDERMFATVGYFAILFVVPLIVKPKSQYCLMHAKQSMVLFLSFIITLILFLVSQTLGSLLTLVIFAFYVICIYKAWSGEWWKVPVLGSFAEKLDISMFYQTMGASFSAVSEMKARVTQGLEQTKEAIEQQPKQSDEKSGEEKKSAQEGGNENTHSKK